MSLPGGPSRVRRFLYGTPHLVGSAALLGGLGLYLGGVVGPGWWAIAGGLYLGAYLVASAFVAEPGALAARLDEADLQNQLDALLAAARGRLPAAALPQLDSIAARARALLPALDDLAGRGVIGDKVRHEILSGLTRYLPDTLSAYLALPPAYLQLHRGRSRDPARLLGEQLGLIDAHLGRCLDQAFGEHAADLAIQGRFLADRLGAAQLPD